MGNNRARANAVNYIIRQMRKGFYNTPVMNWKITGTVYDKVFTLGATDFTKPIEFRGAQFYVDGKDRSYLPTMAAGYYEKIELDIFERLATVSKSFLDIGANIGMYSVLAAAKNPNITCHSFEPVKENYELLASNVKVNGLEKSINVVKKAVSKENGKATIYLSPQSSGMHSLTVKHAGEAREISTVTIDSFCKKRNVQPDLIKVDVEGHEPAAFAGMNETIQQHGATILMEFLAGVNKEMIQLMEQVSKKYKDCYVIDELKGTVTKTRMADLKLHKNHNIILSHSPEHREIIEAFAG